MISNILASSSIDQEKEITAVAALNPCLDLLYASDNASKNYYGLFDWFSGIQLRVLMRESGSVDVLRQTYDSLDLTKKNGFTFDEMWNKNQGIMHFEESLIKPLLGYKCSREKRLEHLGLKKLQEIKNTPIMVIKAENDFIVGGPGLDEKQILKNPNVLLATTKLGGHVGYFEKFWSTHQFQNEPIMSFFNAFR